MLLQYFVLKEPLLEFALRQTLDKSPGSIQDWFFQTGSDAVARLVARRLGMQGDWRSTLTFGTFFCEDMVIKIFL